jgi:hypothetical protein
VDPYVAESARKHGVADADIVHAYANAVAAFELDDDDLDVMLIGADTAGLLLEVGVVESDDGDIVVHAMTARDKYLRRM